MSLFECIDKAEYALQYLEKQNTFWDKSYLFFSREAEKDYDARKQTEMQLFKTIKNELLKAQKLIEESRKNYKVLLILFRDLAPDIRAYLKTASPIFSADLKFILSELSRVANDDGPNNYLVIDRLKKYETDHYKVADAYQISSALGSSEGMCYGMTSMMAIPHLSPYFAENTFGTETPYIPITRQIYEQQNNQFNEKDDQALIKKTTLTRAHFCFNKVKQAKEVLQYAKTQASKDLMLLLKGSLGKHACYLRIDKTSDKKQSICYMDPNHGAYRFDTEAAFIEFYALSVRTHQFTSYQFAEMQYDPDHKLSRDRSFGDIWFSILTGRHYQTYEGITGKLLFGLYITTSVLPILLLTEGAAFLGLLLFPPVLASLLTSLVYAFCITALANDYQGLLGPIQFLEACCCQLGDFVNSLMGGISEEKALEQEVDDVLSDSTFSMA